MVNQYKPELNKKIQSVLTDYHTTKEIFNKIRDAYPELIEYKSNQLGSSENAEKQISAEISARLYEGEDRWYIINRDEYPNTYSLINNDVDEDIDYPINVDINEYTNIEAIEERLNIGYIYIIDTHLQYNNQEIVKIGKANNIDERMNSLNRDQYCFQKPTILYQFKVDRPYKIEHAIHSLLDKGRVNPKKEGFYRDYVESNIDLIKSMIEMFAID